MKLWFITTFIGVLSACAAVTTPPERVKQGEEVQYPPSVKVCSKQEGDKTIVYSCK